MALSSEVPVQLGNKMRYASLLSSLGLSFIVLLMVSKASSDETSWFTKWKVDLCYFVSRIPGKSANYGFPAPAVKLFELSKDTITLEYQEGKRVTSKMQVISKSTEHLLIRTEPQADVVNGVTVSWPSMCYQFRVSSQAKTVILIAFQSTEDQEITELPNSNGILRDNNVVYVLSETKVN